MEVQPKSTPPRLKRNERTKAKTRRRAAFFILLALIVGVFYMTRMGGQTKTDEFELMAKPQVGPLEAAIKDIGNLEPSRLIQVKSEQGGTIKKIFVEEGGKVSQGQRLAIIEQETQFATQLTQARASVRVSETNLQVAKSKYERYKALSEMGIVSKDQFEDYKKNYETTLLQSQNDKKLLWLLLKGSGYDPDVMMQSVDEFIVPRLEQTIVASPIDGIITKINLHEGEQVASGVSFFVTTTALMEVADTTKMQIKAYINEVDIAQVSLGQKVKISLDAIPNREFAGHVSKITPKGQIVENIMSYEVITDIDQKDPTMLPGMTADVDIITGTKENALYIPVEFLQKEGRDAYVYVKENGKKTKRIVTPGIKNELYAEILKGVSPGEAVYRYEQPHEEKKEEEGTRAAHSA
jgi:HlyD family secretion protein